MIKYIVLVLFIVFNGTTEAAVIIDQKLQKNRFIHIIPGFISKHNLRIRFFNTETSELMMQMERSESTLSSYIQNSGYPVKYKLIHRAIKSNKDIKFSEMEETALLEAIKNTEHHTDKENSERYPSFTLD